MKDFARFNEKINKLIYKNKSKSLVGSQATSTEATPMPSVGSPSYTRVDKLTRLNSRDSGPSIEISNADFKVDKKLDTN